jgi:hypothetical protein
LLLFRIASCQRENVPIFVRADLISFIIGDDPQRAFKYMPHVIVQAKEDHDDRN